MTSLYYFANIMAQILPNDKESNIYTKRADEKVQYRISRPLGSWEIQKQKCKQYCGMPCKTQQQDKFKTTERQEQDNFKNTEKQQQDNFKTTKTQ